MLKSSILVLYLTMAMAVFAADNHLSGKWDVTATDSGGNKIYLDMVVTENAGKISGQLVFKSGDGSLDILNPKRAGDVFTFQINLNGDTYSLQCNVDGDKLSAGKYEGPQASGTFEGSRVQASSVAGTWNAVSTDDNGVQNTVLVIIKDDGGKLSGTVEIKDMGLTLPLVEPKIDGNRFVFQIFINDEPYKVETRIDGTKMEGTFAGPEARGTVKGSKAS